MDQPDRAAEPQFTLPGRQIFMMLASLALVALGLWVLIHRVAQVTEVFFANPWLNGFILIVFIFGLLATIGQVVQVFTSVQWVRGYVLEHEGHDPNNPPRLLAALTGLLRGRGAKMQIGATSARSILDSVATRIDEARDLTRYITNLLIFLGLLGTFYGLATTVPALVDTIKSLAPTEGESGVETFARLQQGLESQLGGMGTAFSSSLLGLAGSLVVGLLELFSSHGQNRFYRELEEWISSITTYSFTQGEDASHAPMPAPVAGDSSGIWAAHMAEQIEAMRVMFTQSDTARSVVDDRLVQLADSVDRLTRQIEAEGVSTPYLIRIADGQQRMIEALEARPEDGGAHADAESRMRLRSIDVQLLRILEEMSAGRQESLSELRGDIASLTRAIRHLNGGQG
ncbi:MAG: biopolymer transporter ExbB [Maritimibacter sp.]|nr:biopolymer transporter ExbB [Maritimibacter sp.]